MDLTSRMKSLTGLLGNDCSYATPVHVSSNFMDNALTLSTKDVDIEGLAPVPEFSDRTEKKRFNLPEDMSTHQAPVILLLFGEYDVVQGHVSGDKVLQSIKDYHPVAKTWTEAVHYQSTVTDNF